MGYVWLQREANPGALPLNTRLTAIEIDITILNNTPTPIFFAALQTAFFTSAGVKYGGNHIGLQWYNGEGNALGKAVNFGGYVDPSGRTNGVPSEQIDGYYLDTGQLITQPPGPFIPLSNQGVNGRTFGYNWTVGIPVRLRVELVGNGTWRSYVNGVPFRDSFYPGTDRLDEIVFWTEHGGVGLQHNVRFSRLAVWSSTGVKYEVVRGSVGIPDAPSRHRRVLKDAYGVVMEVYDDAPISFANAAPITFPYTEAPSLQPGRLVWDQIGSRIFETGLDRGVLYPTNSSGVVWNGLLSVEQDLSGASVESLYFSGKKFFDFYRKEDFSGTIKAITYPDKIMEIEGYELVSGGAYFDNQAASRFGLSYRTLLGNDVNGLDFGYRIHLLYNLTAVPLDVGYSSINEEIDPTEFSWKVYSIPENHINYAPISHIIIDSRKILNSNLLALEDILYGSTSSAPRLPSITEVIALIGNASVITIIDNGDGTWTAVGPDSDITMLDATTFQITNANATYLDENTYNISSS